MSVTIVTQKCAIKMPVCMQKSCNYKKKKYSDNIFILKCKRDLISGKRVFILKRKRDLNGGKRKLNCKKYMTHLSSCLQANRMI